MNALRELHLSSLGNLSSRLQRLVEKKLWVQVLFGLACGVLAGVLLGPDLALMDADLALIISSWLALPGHLFLALIQMIVVPLVLASVVRGLTSASSMAQLKELGLFGGALFLIMTVFASIVGITLGQIVDPGGFVDASLIRSLESTGSSVSQSTAISMPSLTELPGRMVGLLPNNPLESFSSGDMLRIVIFAVVFGIALMSLPAKKSAPLYDLLGSLQEVCMTIVSWAMRIAPFAVFGLIAKLTSTVGLQVLAGMLVYVITVIAALFIVAATYILGMSVYTKQSASAFLRESKEALLLAFSTSSSAAVMPLTIKTLEENLKLNSATVRFLVPLGATVNMSGTALYQSIATVFLASVFGIPLDTTAIALIVSMTIFASMGSPATPGASIVILAMMLDNVGIPAAGMALLLGVDRILDMCRTVVNVLGDMTAAIVLDKFVSAGTAEKVIENLANTKSD